MADAAGRDPGLQPERTRLAWRRTTLSCAVTAVLAGRQVALRGGGLLAAVALALVTLAFLLFLRLAHRRIQLLDGSPSPSTMPPRSAAAVAACTMSLALCGAVLLW